MDIELLGLAAITGLLHTWMGPDHYVPFIVMARARRWTLPRTVVITALCGIGHVLGSVVLGTLGIALGAAVGWLEALENLRGDLAAWLMLGFGIAYTAWGLRQARRRRPHSHWHAHADGTVHCHTHQHRGEHAHVHDAPVPRSQTTPWVLFVIFLLGPCEVLIPQLMIPAARGSWVGVCVIVAVFGGCTLLAMVSAVTLGAFGMQRLPLARSQRYGHAAAGAAVTACAILIMVGF